MLIVLVVVSAGFGAAVAEFAVDKYLEIPARIIKVVATASSVFVAAVSRAGKFSALRAKYLPGLVAMAAQESRTNNEVDRAKFLQGSKWSQSPQS